MTKDTGHTPPRILSDDSSNWMDELRDEDEGTEGDAGDSNDWKKNVTTGRSSVTDIESQKMGESPELTLTISHYECSNCGMSTSRSYHSDCESPVIHIGGEWKCGGCGTKVTASTTCFNCGASIKYDRTSVPVDLSPVTRVDDIESAVHEETNRRRTDHGLDPLSYNHHLSAIALRHSRDMAQRDFFDHTSPDGCDAGDRYRKFGHDDRSSGENIAAISLEPTTSVREAAREVVDRWMNSSGHRENILRDRFTKEGIGIHLDSGGTMYATQNFH